jgi:iron complex transport system substrate-binding protein
MKVLKICLICCSVFASFSSWAGTGFPLTITDVAGRSITLLHKPEYVALSTGRDFPLLEILYQKQAAKHLVAWRNDMKLDAPSMYRMDLNIYPRLKNIPFIGQIKSGGFDVERFLELKPRPNVFLMDISDIKPAEENGIIKTLSAAGIKVIAIDFRNKPVENTLKSILSVGKALGREKQAKAFVSYYRQQLHSILSTIAALPKLKRNQRVFLERAAGYSDACCHTFGNGNMGQYISLLSADNIALLPLRGAFTGQMSPETVIVQQPDVYIMQTAGWVNKKGQVLNGIPLGYAPNWPAIKMATKQLMARPWLQALKAYQDHRVYSIYMPFYNSPYNLTAIEFFAKWIYPQAFANLHPDQTFIYMNKTFADKNVTGVFGLDNFDVLKTTHP